MRSTRNHRARTLGVVAIAGVLAIPSASAAAEHPGGRLATFESQQIDLSADWGEATACFVWEAEDLAECFRTENEMDARIDRLRAALDMQEAGTQPTAARDTSEAQCATSVRLYQNTGYGGSVLQLFDRQTWLNLSAYGFSNVTSSYKIGACSATFADLAGGGGSWYPTSLTQAGDVATSMTAGWDNRVSSIYIA